MQYRVITEAQDAQKPAYLDPSLPADQRAADLVGRMTLIGAGVCVGITSINCLCAMSSGDIELAWLVGTRRGA